MSTREKRRLARQLNLDPNTWTVIDAQTSYIQFQNPVTGVIRKFYYGGECR